MRIEAFLIINLPRTKLYISQKFHFKILFKILVNHPYWAHRTLIANCKKKPIQKNELQIREPLTFF